MFQPQSELCRYLLTQPNPDLEGHKYLFLKNFSSEQAELKIPLFVQQPGMLISARGGDVYFGFSFEGTCQSNAE